MEAVLQTNQNECGVCVINALFNHYYSPNGKIQILKKAKINDFGINLLDLESLGLEFNLQLESYRLS